MYLKIGEGGVLCMFGEWLCACKKNVNDFSEMADLVMETSYIN